MAQYFKGLFSFFFFFVVFTKMSTGYLFYMRNSTFITESEIALITHGKIHRGINVEADAFEYTKN